MASLSSILAWKVRWTEKPGVLQSMGPLRIRHDRAQQQHDAEMKELPSLGPSENEKE